MRNSTLFSIILILGFLGLTFMHESVHIQIFSSYGIDSHIEYFSHFPDVVTVADEPCPTEICNLANNINEIVGYHLVIFYVVLGFYFIIKLEKEEKWK